VNLAAIHTAVDVTGIARKRRGSRKHRLPVELELRLMAGGVEDLVAESHHPAGSARTVFVRQVNPAEARREVAAADDQHYKNNQQPAIHLTSIRGARGFATG
jgi:hypothetical protein